MITIIDYGSGNLKSIKNGFLKVGADVSISSDVDEMKDAEALVLPGVGAFGNAMAQLKEYQEVIHSHINDKKPFLGVCLGLQVLFEKSQESPGVEGLSVFEGDVLHFPDSMKSQGLKIPHMGWNKLQMENPCPLFEGVGPEYMYFVHSYYVNPSERDIIAATVDYGFDVPAAVCRGNTFATQFHPEKSGEPGLKILQNFVELI
ncbi:imidazole glycerol phosphate synthase subunit HisH [Methanobacterium aggregans]|uniref:imidazole glycerol phosphate synthase subunit HisH n=1 Tax=Methanobacterium aggregans TaxID=1615586 RepID=UPI001AEAC76A|nr:imidazole glycerol phosphate synthase subunit HisH [Methanobacterium aggregans]MBP2046069.1 glutamine amidotransferase [Methanobacterium aggregans]